MSNKTIKERTQNTKSNSVSILRIIATTLAAIAAVGVITLLIFLFYPMISGFAELLFGTSSLLFPLVIIAALIVVFAFLTFTKALRLKLKMIRALKKLCKKRGYRDGYSLEMSDGILSSNWTNGKGKLVFHTNKRVYHVRIFSIRKYKSILQFESATEMTVIDVLPGDRVGVNIYSFSGQRKVHTVSSGDLFGSEQGLAKGHKKLNIDFSSVTDTAGKETVKAVIICPTCEEWRYKQSNTTYVPTGNAETVFGYKIYTSTGFISDLRRTERV